MKDIPPEPSNNVCARFNAFLKSNNVDEIPDETGVQNALRHFVCNDWMHTDGNRLEPIKDT